MTKLSIVLLASSFAFTACGPGFTPNIEGPARKAEQAIGCDAAVSLFWDTMYDLAAGEGPWPAGVQLERRLTEKLRARPGGEISETEAKRIAAAWRKLYEHVEPRVANLAVTSSLAADRLALIARLELGERMSEESELLQTGLTSSFARLQEETVLAEASCPTPATPNPVKSPTEEGPAKEPPPESPPESPPQADYWKEIRALRPPALFGAYKAMATAYQTCDALQTAPLASTSTHLRGVKIIGMHPNGVGQQRVVGDISAILATHPYVGRAPLASGSCFDVRREPLIYDYGGKPNASTDPNSDLDFHTSAGSGTEALGVDCSGFVFTSLATAGLRLKKSVNMKAVQVNGVSAGMMAAPEKNGFDCLERPTFDGKREIESGDILATTGHVLMIDQTTDDPFGLDRITRVEDCNSAMISYLYFDFVVIQSSPSKGAVGISRMLANDYLSDSTLMRQGLESYALAACRARFGTPSTPTPTQASLLRPSTQAACQDREIELRNSVCVEQCRL